MNGLEIKTLFVGLLVGLAHLASGIAVLVEPNSLNVTPLNSLHDIARWFGFSGGFVGMCLIAAGLMAIIGSHGLIITHWVRSTLFMPQEALLLLQVWSISSALVAGHYPDGYIPIGGAWFVLTDQIWAWTLAVSHSIWLAAFCFKGGIHGRAD